MSGNSQRGSTAPSSAKCQLSQDSEDDDVDNVELWNHRPLQHQVGFLSLGGGFSGGLSPQPSSSVECERRVSPLDPNLSSAARYSPPPPYSNPIDEIEQSIDHQNSPLDHLSSHSNTLPSFPPGVSSSISSANDNLVITKSHRFSSISNRSSANANRDCGLPCANSLFSTPASLARTQHRWVAPRVTVTGGDLQDHVRPPAESIWAKQKRLASNGNLSIPVSQSSSNSHDDLPSHDSNVSQILSPPGPSGLQEGIVPGSSDFQALPRHSSSSLQRLVQPEPVRNHKVILQTSTSNAQRSPRAGPSGLQSPRPFGSNNSDNMAQAGTSIVHSHEQSGSNRLPGITLPLQLLSKLKDLPQLPSKSDDSHSEDDNDEPSHRLRFSPTPGPSVVQNHLVNLNDSDAEALAGIVSGCEASSSNAQGHFSPLRSPSTPTDNCIVSSSTGHIDSIPPTPIEFQGNDVSGPNSPMSPNLACAAILDSTVDSTSGRGILDADLPQSDNDSDVDLSANAELPLVVMPGDGGQISTSEVGLHNSNDSEDVELLVSPDVMFSSGRGSPKHFMDQISLSLAQFPTNSLDASLSSVGDRCEPHIPSTVAESYLDDHLAIPGPSGVSSRVPSQVSNSRQSRSSPRDHNLDQPSTSSRQELNEPVEVLDSSLPILDISGGLSGCSTSDADHLALEGESEPCESMVSLANSISSNTVSENLAGPSASQRMSNLNHHSSYALELNDESSISSDALSTSSLGKEDLSDRGINHSTFGDVGNDIHHHHLISSGQLVSASLGSSLNLNLASSVNLPGTSRQHSLGQHLQPDQVSLLVGGGDESNDGALLMMVSSNGDALPDTLTLGKPLEANEASNTISQLSDSNSRVVQSGGIDQNMDSLHYDDHVSRRQDEGKLDTDKSIEAFMEANFWCSECEQMYNIECPQHRMQDMADRTIKTRGWNSMPIQQLVLDKSPDLEDCMNCDEKSSADCAHYGIQTICDKPVKTRAWASLPAQHLVIRKVPCSVEYGVFTRKSIPKRTRFGPLEGLLVDEEDSNNSDRFTVCKGDQFLELDTSDEDRSNWMRFVRKAETYLEQNCVVVQVDEALYFLTSTDIAVRSELKVGYSKHYADKRNLSTLEPTNEEIEILDAMRKSWPCYECDEGFETSAGLQKHLACHDDKVKDEDKKKRKKVKTRRTKGADESNSKQGKRQKLEADQDKVQAGPSGNQKELPVESILDTFKRSQCLTCNLIFSMPDLLSIHALKHFNSSPPSNIVTESIADKPEDERDKEVSLNNNQFDAISKEEIERREKEISDSLLPYDKMCPFCKKVFDSDNELLSHVDEHGAFHPGSSKPFKCDLCYKSFTRRFRLEAHMSVHGNETTKPFSCSLCLRRFCSKSALTAHVRFHIEGCKGYDCPICREGFFSVAGLKAHVSTHCINGEYKCPKCNKVFPTYSKIRRHIRSYHALMPHVCPVCSKEMPSVDKLKIHMLSHSDRRDFLCPDCGKRFKRKDKLREHSKRMHSGEREEKAAKTATKGPPKFVPKVDPADYKQFLYKCTICMLGFKRRGMLVNHLAKRHPSVDMKCVPELNRPILKPTPFYKCQHCDKRYRSTAKRKLHILKYHPGAELPPKAKSVADNDTEGSSYTSSYPHPCNWCHRQYASRARLLRHQRHHHPFHYNEANNESTQNDNNIAFIDAPPPPPPPSSISGELNINGQVVADANILRNHRLVSVGRPSTSSAEAEGNDLLTQAMGEITPLAARQVLVSGDGGQQGPTLALVTADGPEPVTLSLAGGQLFSLIPSTISMAGPSSVTSTSRHISNGGAVDGVLQREEESSSVRMTYALGSNNEAEAVEQVVLSAAQPPSPSNQVVWQHALTFSSTSS